MTDGALIEAAIVGAGVVGLAVAREFALAGLEPVILERHARIGEESSSRNSGVIHSGLYYESQVGALRRLHEQGSANKVPGLQWLDAAGVRELEPAVRCAAGLHSPRTGIVDVHQLMLALQGDCEAHGGAVALRSPVERMQVVDGGIEITVGGESPGRVVARRLVNAAGLGAIDLARRTDGYPKDLAPAGHFAKGHYFSVRGSPFRRLVYPMPNEAGLGIHATLDLDGSVRFGPDVEWVDTIDYAVPPERAAAFYESIREYWPGLPDGSLSPAYAGVRPKIVGPGRKAADFMIQGPDDHGIGGLVNLFGIESPGLTAALALGGRVASMLL